MSTQMVNSRPAVQAATRPAAPKMELRGISKKFSTRRGEVVALAECNLAVEKARIRHGGRSLRLREVDVDDDSGRADRTDAPATSWSTDCRPGPPGPKRSVVFQRFALFPSETAAQNIEFGLRVAGIDKAERDARVTEQLALMGLSNFATPIRASCQAACSSAWRLRARSSSAPKSC